MEIQTFAFMGKPGSGKGEQAKLLAGKLGFRHLSTGEIMREMAKGDSIASKKLKETIDAGFLTPYWFASYVFEDAVFNLRGGEGIVLEGAIRTEPEARIFHEAMQWLSRPYRALYLGVSDDELLRRILGRAQVEGRADDTATVFKEKRLAEFQKHTAPAIAYLREQEVVVDINGEQTIEEVHREVLQKLGLK